MKYYSLNKSTLFSNGENYYMALDDVTNKAYAVYRNKYNSSGSSEDFQRVRLNWFEVPEREVKGFNSNFFKEIMSKTLEDIKTELKEAKKKFKIGTKVCDSCWKERIVTGIWLFLEPEKGATSFLVEQDIKNHGYCVAVIGNGYSEPWKLPQLITIKVNGYEAVDTGDTYTFGCAVIDKDLLRFTKEFLQKEPLKGNRGPKSVKIGEGEFTLEILKSLNL